MQDNHNDKISRIESCSTRSGFSLGSQLEELHDVDARGSSILMQKLSTVLGD